MARLRRTLESVLETEEVVINLFGDEEITKVDDVATLKDNLKRKTAYTMYRAKAGLVIDTWCYALNISKERDAAYRTGNTVVPNSILNRAAYTCRRVNSLTKRIHERF